MALKIRLRQQGRVNRPSYRLVVTNVQAKRDGEYVEALGWYDPFAADDKGVAFHEDRIEHWLGLGAQFSESAASLVARTAPSLYKRYHEKVLAAKDKVRAKRRTLRQKTEA